MAARVSTFDTDTIRIAYEATGPSAGPVAVLLHGFPDDVRAWDGVTPGLHERGYRTIVPWLRGFGPTRLRRDPQWYDGHLAALTQDLVALFDHLAIKRATVIGHDWGARAAQAGAVVMSDRIDRLISLSRYAIAFGGGYDGPPPWETFRALWYQWFLNVDVGRAMLDADPRGMARYLWRLWSPTWHPADDMFAATAPSFDNPDFVPIVVSAYREAYAQGDMPEPQRALAEWLSARPVIPVPTTVLQGRDDGVDLMETATDESDLFPAGYRREIIDGAGHFLHRERPDIVLDAFFHQP